MEPSRFTVLAGANAAGKSNIGDCYDFLRQTYSNGLAVAIATKGGYENIAHRKMRRTKQPIALHVVAIITPPDYLRTRGKATLAEKYRVSHSFSFVAKGASIRARYRVSSESIRVEALRGDTWQFLYVVSRAESGLTVSETQHSHRSDDRYTSLQDLSYFVDRQSSVPDSELFISIFGRFVPVLADFVNLLSRVKVFQLSPSVSRDVGTPGPIPELGRFGEDLPAVVDLLKRDYKDAWQSILTAMKVILPDLDNIEVDYTSTRRLGLFFHEKGVGKPWTTEDVSDGTIQMLALLTAIFDDRASLLYVEEPENSVHPWAIRSFIRACKSASKSRQIMITTHSPVVIDSSDPRDVLIVWRSRGETKVRKLTELDGDILQAWEDGRISTFKFLDSGVVSESVPPVAQLRLQLDE